MQGAWDFFLCEVAGYAARTAIPFILGWCRLGTIELVHSSPDSGSSNVQ